MNDTDLDPVGELLVRPYQAEMLQRSLEEYVIVAVLLFSC
jgi:hypothetical protein